MTSDPIGLAGGINTYVYVDSNPLVRIDPNGKKWVPCSWNTSQNCWVPDPNLDNKPTCVTAECAAGLQPARDDFRTVEEIDCSQCRFSCDLATNYTPGPSIPTTWKKVMVKKVMGSDSNYSAIEGMIEASSSKERTNGTPTSLFRQRSGPAHNGVRSNIPTFIC